MCPRRFSLSVSFFLIAVGRYEAVKFIAGHAKPALEGFELCDLLRIFELNKSAESSKH